MYKTKVWFIFFPLFVFILAVNFDTTKQWALSTTHVFDAIDEKFYLIIIIIRSINVWCFRLSERIISRTKTKHIKTQGSIDKIEFGPSFKVLSENFVIILGKEGSKLLRNNQKMIFFFFSFYFFYNEICVTISWPQPTGFRT